MNKKILIVEDQFVEANDLQLMLERAGYVVCGIARSVPVAEEMIKKEKPGFVLLDIFLKGKLTGIDLARQLKEDNIAFIYLSANSNEEILSLAKTTEPYGFLVKPFREKDLLVTIEIAQYRHENSSESKSRREAELIQQLERCSDEKTDRRQKLLQIGKIIQQGIPFDFMSVGFDRPEGLLNDAIGYLRIGFDEYQSIGIKELLTIAGITMDAFKTVHAMSGKETVPLFFNKGEFETITQQASLKKLFKETFQMKSVLLIPLLLSNGETLCFYFYSRRTDGYSPEHIKTFHLLQQAVIKCIGTKMGNNDAAVIQVVNNELQQVAANNVNREVFKGIIGNSHLLLNVFDHIMQVSPFDTAVLILGESGTGKERIANCIHKLSPWKNKPLVKVNCAALPATLIESELFGHERGSFTGATEKRMGKFEQANGGTIFLDEIGEMPVDLQVKLLRVLQEKEIEPIGGRAAIKINVRIITATNRNLEKEVAEGRFRLDLYYRLNVFPITLPPLRERGDDILILANYFINYYNRKAGKKITGLSAKAQKNMMNYSWPGNIRELENLIERSVLLAKGSIIEDVSLPTSNNKAIFMNSFDFRSKTIDENERDHIITILRKCNGKVWGSGGAAELLNIPPSTLKSKMKKLGIPKAIG